MSAQKKLLVCGSKVFDATKLRYQQILEALGVPCVVPVIYLLTDVPGFCAQELWAWATVPLRGCVDQLVCDYITQKPEVRMVAAT